MSFDKLAWQRERRKQNHNIDTKRYEKSPKGFLMRLYRNMQSRVTGIQKREAQYYQGLPLLERQSFYTWAMQPDSAFWPLYSAWREAGFTRCLTPSVDRIDVFRGYLLNNMRWMPHSQNSANITRKRILVKEEVVNGRN